MGPILIFDKSALQMLNLDEAVLLDNFFLSNITPVFFVETLADLEKEVSAGRRPEDVVGHIARKTPLGSKANLHHATLAAQELIGNPIPLQGQICVGGGRRSLTASGRKGVVLTDSPEEEALKRWGENRFLDVERNAARG
jgi:hypothetical protein